jgi:hypothetical protein
VVGAATPVQCVGATLQSAEDLARYAGCEAVTGDLIVTGTDLSDLQALERVRSVSGTLAISENPYLDDLRGLGRLERVGRLTIEGNADLDDLSGLTSLTEASSLIIRGNPELTSLRGLEGLRHTEQLVLADNGLYRTTGVENLREVRQLAIVGNARLHDLRGFAGLQRAHSIRLEENPRLCAQLGIFPRLKDVTRVLVRENRGLLASEVDALRARLGTHQQWREAALK